MEFHFSEQKFKKMRQSIIVPNLLWVIVGTFITSLANQFDLMASFFALILFSSLFGFVGFVWLRRTNKVISKMKDNKLWITDKGLAMSGEMGSSEMPFSTIEKFKLLKYQGLPSIMFKLSNGEKTVINGLENQTELVNQLKIHLPNKFSTNVFFF